MFADIIFSDLYVLAFHKIVQLRNFLQAFYFFLKIALRNVANVFVGAHT